MKTQFELWFESKYQEAMQMRDGVTCDWLLDNMEAIRYGYNASYNGYESNMTLIEGDGITSVQMPMIGEDNDD